MKFAKYLKIVSIKWIPALLLCFLCISSFAQMGAVELDNPAAMKRAAAPGWLNLRKIVVTGNKKTKEYIILREMGIKAGDSIIISTLTKRLSIIRQYIYNTTLFVIVKVEPIIVNAYTFDIIVTVKERFYVFPIPQFQLADRSFNEWLVKYKGSLSRVNYGMKFVHYNISGRKDQFRLNLINGYTRNISASYNMPYSNAKLTEGFYVEGGYSQTKEIPYKTNYDNTLAYFKNGDFVRDYWYFNSGYILRRAIKFTQIFSAGYQHMHVSDSVISNNYNLSYFNNHSASQGFVDLGYTVKYTDVDNILYPLEGISGYASLRKRGLGFKGGINMISLEAQLNHFKALGNKWYSSLQLAGKIKLPFHQAFINQAALGDRNNFLRGLEYYNIDGVVFGTAKFNLKKEFLNFTIPTFFKSKTYNKIPFKFYAKVFSDFGYVYAAENPRTRLNNKLLSTAGIGVDVLTLYDIHIRIDYSLNQLGQKNLAVNNKSGF